MNNPSQDLPTLVDPEPLIMNRGIEDKSPLNTDV